jgi:hypothetical protein
MKNLLISLFCLLPFIVSAQDKFPDLTGKTLEGSSLTIPSGTEGKYTLIGIAYSKKAEDDLQTWFEPIYRTFIQKQESTFLPIDEYDVNIYFIPMITGIAKAASDKIEDKIKQGTDKELQPYILLYEGEIKTYKEKLKMDEKDTPYFFVLDPDGNIKYAFSGPYTEEKLDLVLDELE